MIGLRMPVTPPLAIIILMAISYFAGGGFNRSFFLFNGMIVGAIVTAYVVAWVLAPPVRDEQARHHKEADAETAQPRAAETQRASRQ
jgi:hypothetical protein